MTQEIQLTNWGTALVDDAEYEAISRFSWYNEQGYAARMSSRTAGKRVVLRMHWQVIPLPPGFVIDHINGNRLDNRRCNLRIVSRADNNKNRLANKAGTSSQFKGVTWREHAHAWKAYIKINRKQIHLGYFKSEIEAAKAYNEAAQRLFGEFARPNEIGVAA